jgi:heat shock protein HslJ
MQDAHEQYVGTRYQPLEQEQAAERTVTVRRVAFAVLALALCVAVGLGAAWLSSRATASGSGGVSPEFVASSTPRAAVASPTTAPEATPDPTAVTPATASSGSSGPVADDTAPATPKLLSPSDGVVVSDAGVQVTLKWSEVTDPSGVRYRVQVQQWIGGGADWQTTKLVKGIKHTHYALSVSAVRLRWRIIAVDLVGNVGTPSKWRAIVPVSPLVFLQDKKWLLTTISDGAGGMLDPLDGTHASIRFNSETGSVGGNTGVNAFSAPYVASEDGGMHVGMITTTMMAGSPDAMKQEMLLKNALHDATTWHIENSGKTLKLLAGGHELAVFTR